MWALSGAEMERSGPKMGWAGAERGAGGRGGGVERRAGVTKIGLSGERKIGRSHSAHMLCSLNYLRYLLTAWAVISHDVIFYSCCHLHVDLYTSCQFYRGKYDYNRKIATKHWRLPRNVYNKRRYTICRSVCLDTPLVLLLSVVSRTSRTSGRSVSVYSVSQCCYSTAAVSVCVPACIW